MSTSAPPDRIDASRAALIVYDACRRALAPADPARRAAMRPVLDAWVTLIGGCRAHGLPIIYTTPVSRADGADVVLLPTRSEERRVGKECRHRRAPYHEHGDEGCGPHTADGSAGTRGDVVVGEQYQ